MIAYLKRKRRQIRSGVFNNERQMYVLLSSGAQYEAAKGLILVAPGLALCIVGMKWLGLPILIIGVCGFLGWSTFVWIVAIKAAAEKSDKIYQRFTRKHLSREYRDS